MLTHAAHAGFAAREFVGRSYRPTATPRSCAGSVIIASSIGAVVGAVDARLHEHPRAHAQGIEHLPVISQQRIRRRVDSAVEIVVARRQPKCARMTIGGSCRA
jgi:hypothetical protein